MEPPADPSAHRDTARPFAERAADLVSQMTLGEKVSQMVHPAAAIERLGVPAFNWWNECLHGVGRAGVATVFPQAIGLAATWDVDLMRRVATAIGDEARAKHHAKIRETGGDSPWYYGLTFWTPNVNLFRDPRWGRGQETYGEDPHLTARIGVAFCRALQGDDPNYLKLVATPKHFAVHSGPEAARHGFDAQVSPRDLRETYLPAFKACVTEAKAESVPVPIRHLEGFRRVSLAPGETRTVSFTIGPDALVCYAEDGRPLIEPGRFLVSIGGGQPLPGPDAPSFVTGAFEVVGEGDGSRPHKSNASG